MDHDEHPAVGCVRETLEEMGIKIEYHQMMSIITQNFYKRRNFICFFHLQSQLGWSDSQIKLKENEISPVRMAFTY